MIRVFFVKNILIKRGTFDAYEHKPVSHSRFVSFCPQSEAPRKYRKVRRAITNAFSSKKSAEHPTRKRRSRTVCGVNVALSLLTNVKHSSCLYVKNSSGVWAKRWCVFQDGNLHFFKYADDQKPSLSLCINQVGRACVFLILVLLLIFILAMFLSILGLVLVIDLVHVFVRVRVLVPLIDFVLVRVLVFVHVFLVPVLVLSCITFVQCHCCCVH